jgi:hypothetical protein
MSVSLKHYATPERGTMDFTAPEGRGSRPRVGTSVASGGPRASTAAQGGGKTHWPDLEGGIMHKLRKREDWTVCV